MGYTPKKKAAKNIAEDANLSVSEPAITYRIESKPAANASDNVTFTVDPNLKSSGALSKKSIEAKELFDRYYKTH